MSSDGELAAGELVDAVLRAGRVLVALADQSLAAADDEVTLAQHRVLSELADRGPQRLADLAGVLGVDRSTATRMCDRLVRKGLVDRRRLSDDRRGVRIALSGHGRALVDAVGARRREQIRDVVRRMPESNRRPALEALRAFVTAAGDAPEQAWSRGWQIQ